MVDRTRVNLLSAHQEWLGFVRPVGLLLSPTIMVDSQVVPDRNVAGRQREFRDLLSETGSGASVRWQASDLRQIFIDFLGWDEGDLVDASNFRNTLEIALPELQVVLSPTWAVPSDLENDSSLMMLIGVEETGSDLDMPPDDGGGWNATRNSRFERLLRETGISVGLLCTDERIRLVYAPKGESSGHVTFEFSQMAMPAGRPILAAFDMLLSAEALFNASPDSRLPTLLMRSRDVQAEVSTKLSKQVLASMYELLRGFASAGKRDGGVVLNIARQDPSHLYGGLITSLMRMVFVLYAEDRGLMPDHPVYQQNYSLGGLFARLRADAAAWPDTMDQRFGAWAQVLALFRLVHGGGRHAGLSFVARKGTLFDPDRFPFLEGQHPGESSEVPMVPDATVWKILQSLMILDGERLSYRTLDVEQIGSVYESVMGFRVELTTGHSIAVASHKRNGASVVVDIDSLLRLGDSQRAKSFRELTDRKLNGEANTALRSAATVHDVVAALDRAIDRDATPDIVPDGTPILQPTDERRRSGSHYTPRSLTEPIVSEALRPVLEKLGPSARPEEILDLKVLDPAAGSGAFLVEACRQISAKLVEAWGKHGGPIDLPTDEDKLLHARRLVAQRCLYGVDKNPMAIDLARLSLWLVTLARDHEFTFIDHALRPGDSLVGLTREQIEAFHWDVDKRELYIGFEADEIKNRVKRASELRQVIRELGDEAPEGELRELLDAADRELKDIRRIADLVLVAFFDGRNAGERERKRLRYADILLQKDGVCDQSIVNWRPSVTPFHWEFEFTEVFERPNPGFDAIVGNPPFAGKNTVAAAEHAHYPVWLRQLHPESHGNSDLVAYFFYRAFNLLREDGAFGLIATNTIGQGDTRSTGLRWICKHGGTIYRAQCRLKWPGEAAVVVSVVHVARGNYSGPRVLEGQLVDRITAFLFHDGGHDDPERLAANAEKSFVGSYVLGMGFTFDDTDSKGVATPLAVMERLIEDHPRNQEVIFPYVGGEEVNTSPTHAYHRHAINFRDWPLRRSDLGATWRDADKRQRQNWRRKGIVPLDYSEPVAADWPELLAIVENTVKPQRAHLTANAIGRKRAMFWWQYGSAARELYATIREMDRVLVISEVGQHMAFAFLEDRVVFSHTLKVFPFDTHAAFCALQSRPHEIWARFFASSLEDRLRYTPSDCFETFPFPPNWEEHPALEAAGKEYYEFRASLMIENDQGMTQTYNRFHDPDEHNSEIVRLRELHTKMDRAVLDAYGWSDIPLGNGFLLDYEIEEESWGRRKKPWRCRWPDEVRNEVLARLLALNAERAEEERMTGSAKVAQ